tara:strand:- start:751 stop:993 length:243 start_codon:yes stop_codon:yes gene_type:complete
MKDFITLAISLTIVSALVIMFWFFYTLPLYIVWNFVIGPIFGYDELSYFNTFMMMIGLNIIYIIIAYARAPYIDNENMNG